MLSVFSTLIYVLPSNPFQVSPFIHKEKEEYVPENPSGAEGGSRVCKTSVVGTRVVDTG